MNNQTFAEELRKMRTKAGWSRPKMVDRVGVPLRTIEDWESEKRTPPEYVQHLVLDRLQLEIENDKRGEDVHSVHCEKCGSEIICLPTVKEHPKICPICKADIPEPEKDEMAEIMAKTEREANLLYLKGQMKAHEEWKAKHPRPKKER